MKHPPQYPLTPLCQTWAHLWEVEQKAHPVLDATQVDRSLRQSRWKLHVGVSCQDQP